MFVPLTPPCSALLGVTSAILAELTCIRRGRVGHLKDHRFVKNSENIDSMGFGQLKLSCMMHVRIQIQLPLDRVCVADNKNEEVISKKWFVSTMIVV